MSSLTKFSHYGGNEKSQTCFTLQILTETYVLIGDKASDTLLIIQSSGNIESHSRRNDQPFSSNTKRNMTAMNLALSRSLWIHSTKDRSRQPLSRNSAPACRHKHDQSDHFQWDVHSLRIQEFGSALGCGQVNRSIHCQ